MINSYDKYQEFREHGPVIVQDGFQGKTTYVIGHEEAKLVLGDQKRFIKDPNSLLPKSQRPQNDHSADLFRLAYDNMLSADPPDHTRLRALVSKAFTNRRVQSLAPRIQEIADQLIDDFEGKGSVDLIDAFAFPLPIIVICELLGVPSEDRDKFRTWSHAFLGVANEEGSYVQLLTEFVQYIGQMIVERRENPKDDLISALVHAEEEGKQLSEQELYAMIALLIVAGHETTVNLIGNGMAVLLQYPEQARLLRDEPDLIDGAIEEFIRHEGPVEMATTRYAAEDVTISGIHIKQGTPVTVILAAANRDPNIYDDAEFLDVTRKASQQMGFGYGIHYCVGAPLARLEGKIAFRSLLRRLPSLRISGNPADLEYVNASVVHGLRRLPVTWN
ncbi:MAG: cytochrome P450 [Chloroflexota bacterium]